MQVTARCAISARGTKTKQAAEKGFVSGTETIEQRLRERFSSEPRSRAPREVFQQLAAFWPHFALHKRRCDRSGESIISIYSADCPYPVWRRELWVEHANPPQAELDMGRPFYEQLWELFRRCPIPHNIGANNENCDYTDDWWSSKNCYLSHSGFACEDCDYCYRVLRLKDCQHCVFSADSELCSEIVNSEHCHSLVRAISCRGCYDSAFLFDCRDCSDCFMCWNLRRKRHCIENVQYSPEEYRRRRAEYALHDRSTYDALCARFESIVLNRALWKSLELVRCENVHGTFLNQARDVHEGFYLSEAEDSALILRGHALKSCLECVSPLGSELCFRSVLAQDTCYDIRNCLNVVRCRRLEYSAQCMQCTDCFGCCGLVGKQYCILNTQYSKEEYERRVGEIRSWLERDPANAEFFPSYFAPNSYQESLADVYYPLSEEEAAACGFRTYPVERGRPPEALDVERIPAARDADESLSRQVFWDSKSGRPLRITKRDISFAATMGTPLPNRYYISAIRELFAWMPFSGELRETRCAGTGEHIWTNLDPRLDGRIFSEKAFEEAVV